jgi:DNA-binding response OmpR family regulator
MLIKLTIVEDDLFLREALMTTFEKKGYAVTAISSFESPETEIMALQPDLLVLDLNLPGRSGFDLCKWLKARTTFPILILTASDALDDELLALGLGADDFLTKPCHPDRLLARVERLLERYHAVKNVIRCGRLLLDQDTYKLTVRDRNLILTETEGKILQTLMQHHPAVVSRAVLLEAVWGSTEFVDENILQVNMTRLRKSLSAIDLGDIIRTVRGRGYCLEADAE